MVGFATDVANMAVGGAEVRLVEMMLTGPIGLTLGLGAVVLGIWEFAQQNNAAAIALVLGGALITLAPGIYNGAHAVVCPITQALGNDVEC